MKTTITCAAALCGLITTADFTFAAEIADTIYHNGPMLTMKK